MPEGVDPDALVLKHTPGAEAGDAAAMMLLSAAYLMKQDWATAEFWAQRSADAGSVIGMQVLAELLEQRGDQAGAQEWKRRADEADSPSPAARNIERLVAPIVARFGEDPDPQQVRPAAQDADVIAMTALGMQLMQDDPQQAVDWFTRGAEAGYPLAMFALGGALLDQGDNEAADRWLKRAAESGDSALTEVLNDFGIGTGDAQKARPQKASAREPKAAEADTGPDAESQP